MRLLACGLALLAGIPEMLAAQDWLTLDGPFQPMRGVALDTHRRRLVGFGQDGETWEWDGPERLHRVAGTAPFGRTMHAMVYDRVQRHVLLYGGRTPFNDVGDSWLWNGSEWRPDLSVVSPPRRSGAGMVFDSLRSRVVLFGGADSNGARDDVWEHDGSQWLQLSPAVRPPVQSWPGLAFDTVRGVSVMLGSSVLGGPVTWEWNGSAWRFVTSSGPAPRSWAAMAFDEARARTVFAGGLPGSNEVWEYDGAQWSLAATVNGFDRYRHAMYFDPFLGRVVIQGGVSAGNLEHSDAWTWDGHSLARLWGERSPTVRAQAAVAHDELRHRTVLFGGLGAAEQADTWEWDGVRWSQERPRGAPSPRHAAGCCFDPSRGVVWLFGGRNGNTDLGDTWSWDGREWHRHVPVQAPGARAGAALAWDPGRGRVLSFGGFTIGIGYHDDTWEWNGTAWSQVATSVQPSPRINALLTRDPLRGRIVLFGGLGPNGSTTTFLNDTWEWDGAHWQARATAAVPPLMDKATAAFDPIAGRVALVGCQAGGSPAVEAWDFDGADWQARTAPVMARPDAIHMVTDAAGAKLILCDFRTVRELTSQPAQVAALGTGCSPVPPLLACRTRPRVGDAGFGLEAIVASSLPVVFGLSATSGRTPLSNGCELILQQPLLAPRMADAGGLAVLAMPLPPDPRLHGLQFFAQASVLSALAPGGFALSSGLRVTVGD